MTKVKVLLEGYIKNKIKVVPTTTLIQDGKTNIIVDPGMVKYLGTQKDLEETRAQSLIDFLQ